MAFIARFVSERVAEDAPFVALVPVMADLKAPEAGAIFYPVLGLVNS